MTTFQDCILAIMQDGLLAVWQSFCLSFWQDRFLAVFHADKLESWPSFMLD